jgi:WD40 repeat protein
MKQNLLFTCIFLPIMMTTLGCSHAIVVKTASISPQGPAISSLPAMTTMISPLAVIQKEAPIYSLSLSPEGRYLAIGSAKKIVIWDNDRPGELRTIESGEHDILSLAFSPDSKRLAAGSYLTIDLLNVDSGQRETTLSGHTDYVQSLAFSPDGRFLASGSRGTDTAVYIWNIDQNGLLKRLTYPTKHAETISALAFTSDQRWLASVGLDRTIRIWNVVRKSTDVHQTLFDPSTTPLTIAFSPDRTLLAAGTWEGPLVLYGLKNKNGEILRTLTGHHGKVLALAFSPNGKRLISVGEDKTIRRWRVDTGAEIDTQGLSDEFALGEIAMDSRHVAVAGPRGAAVFALEDLKKLPPVVILFSPLNRQTVKTPIVRLTGKAMGDQDPIKIEIQLNGMLWKSPSGTGNKTSDAQGTPSRDEISIDEEIRLVAGQNVITVTANDSEGLSQTESIQITYLPETEGADVKDSVEHEPVPGKNEEGR